MQIRYITQVLLTSLTFGIALGVAPTPEVLPTCPPAHPLPYAPRVVRHIRATLQLRVLEARRARLALVEGAIVHRMTIDQLLALPDDAAVLVQGSADGRLKHFYAQRASTCW